MTRTRPAPVGAATLRWRGRHVKVSSDAMACATRLGRGYGLAVLVEVLEAHQGDEVDTAQITLDATGTLTVSTTAEAGEEAA